MAATASPPTITRYQDPYADNVCCSANSTSAPRIGPSIVPMPPISTMNSMETEYWMLKTDVGSTYRVCSAISAPTAPAPPPATR